jgi:peptide/nickel transport system permease protein
MQGYVIRRLLLLIPCVFIVSIIVFFLVRFVPGSVIDLLQATLSRGGMGTTVDRAVIEHALGLDVPAYIQYWRWIGNIVMHGNFGNSLVQGKPVMDMVLSRIPVTFELGLLAIAIDVLISLPIGVYSAIRQDTMGDYVSRTFAVILMAVPSFWLATLIMIYPSLWWGWAPPLKFISFVENPIQNLKMIIIPAAILGMGTAGGTMRMTRTMMLEVMRQDYIRTAWAKGLTEETVVIRHATRNAFIPVITILGNGLGVLIGGAVILEQIFNLPGMGLLILQALNDRDYPLVSAVTLLVCIFVMLCNLLIDISYGWLDPRVSYE